MNGHLLCSYEYEWSDAVSFDISLVADNHNALTVASLWAPVIAVSLKSCTIAFVLLSLCVLACVFLSLLEHVFLSFIHMLKAFLFGKLMPLLDTTHVGPVIHLL